jgi:hypothetical protein
MAKAIVSSAVKAATVPTLDAAMIKLGKLILSTWRTGKGYIALGIREKTATGLGTRSAMLAVAAYGYPQGQGRLMAQAVRKAMGLDANVGGIDFPWLEKAANIATITSSSAIRLDAKTGLMRLQVLPTGKAATAARRANPGKGKAAKAATARVDTARVNGPVTVTRAPVAPESAPSA